MTGPRQPDTVAADAVDDLYRAHGLGLIRFALMLVGDQGTAEDVVQEAFLALYRGWHRVDDPGAALAYLRAAQAGDPNRAEALARAITDPDEQAQALCFLATAAAQAGEPDRARHLLSAYPQILRITRRETGQGPPRAGLRDPGTPGGRAGE